MPARLILASASPRRKELLDQIGVDYEVYPVDIDENMRRDEGVVEFVQRLAAEKARAAYQRLSESNADITCLGADTVVEIGGDALGKPENTTQAAQILARLSAKKHKVHTAIALKNDSCELTDISTSTVEFAALTPQQIESYISTGEPMDKAGAYAIQGIAGQFVTRLDGSYSGVMGLPLYETAKLLSDCGVSVVIKKSVEE